MFCSVLRLIESKKEMRFGKDSTKLVLMRATAEAGEDEENISQAHYQDISLHASCILFLGGN